MTDRLQIRILPERQLRQQRARFSIQFVGCGILCVLVSVIAALIGDVAGRVIFGVVAMFFAFFAWNRFMELKRINLVIQARSDSGAVERLIRDQIERPPLWDRISGHIAQVTWFVLLFGLNTLIAFEYHGWVRWLWLSVVVL